MPHNASGNPHLTNIGYRWLGGYFGIALKRALIDGQKPRYLQPLAAVWDANNVTLRYSVPVGWLRFDTTYVTAIANQGFGLLDNTGSPVSITSVTVLGRDRVRVNFASGACPTGSRVCYAWGVGMGDVTGPVNGPRGTLCDNQGATITANGLRMDNYAPIHSFIRS